MATISVSDSRSNENEQIEAIAKALRSRHRRLVFEAIYYHRADARSVREVETHTGLSRVRVLQEAGYLANKGFVTKTRKNGELAYGKDQFIQANKRQILRFALNPKNLEKLPTKRRPERPIKELKLAKSIQKAQVRMISVDDVSSFSQVRRVRAQGNLPATISETAFKVGVANIIGEPYAKRDWGGERNDLHSTRLKLKAKRIAAAFAFKGPGTKAKRLVPARMGKNGDQIQRLFQTDAEVFFVQYWQEIDESVLEQMRVNALVKSVSNGSTVFYGAIDGQDSYRLYRAYPHCFA